MTAATWNRRDGQPDYRRLDQALDRMVEALRHRMEMVGRARRNRLAMGYRRGKIVGRRAR